MASIRDDPPPYMFFQPVFFCYYHQSFTEHNRYALSVIAGGRGDVQKVRRRLLATACLALGITHLIKRVSGFG